MKNVTWSSKIINPLLMKRSDLEQLLTEASRMIYEVDSLRITLKGDPSTDELVRVQGHLKKQVEKIGKLYKIVPAEFAVYTKEQIRWK